MAAAYQLKMKYDQDKSVFFRLKTPGDEGRRDSKNLKNQWPSNI